MSILILSIFSSFSFISSQPSPFGFNVQRVGKIRYVPQIQESSRNFCNTVQCLNDADILFTRSSQYEASDPCVDFANFTVGNAIEVGPVFDGNTQRGFGSSVSLKFKDLTRRALIEKIKKSDGNFVRNVKKMIKKFLKSDHLFRHIEGHREFVEYVEFLGGSPYLSKHLAWNKFLFDKSKDFGFLQPKNSSALDLNLWNEKNFDLQKLAEFEPEHFLKYFFDLELKRCKNPSGSGEILCFVTFEYISSFKIISILYKSAFEEIDRLYRMLETMNDFYVAGYHGKIELKEKMFDPAIESFEIFLNSRSEILDDFEEFEGKVVKIKELKLIHEDLKIDWLKLINSQLFEEYQVTEDDEILVKDLKMMKNLAENLTKMPKSITSDFFVISFSFENVAAFQFHLDDLFQKSWTGNKKSWQRYEILWNRLFNYLPTTLEILYDEKYGDKKIKESAEKFITDALKEARKRFIKNSNLPLSVSIKVLNKLKSAKIFCGFDQRLMGNLTLDTFHAEIPQNLDKNFLFPNREKKSFNYVEMKMFGRKIITTPKNDARRLITMKATNNDYLVSKMVDNYEYDLAGENVLYIPSKTLIYPYYHPDRPRFFNMATLFVRAIFMINSGIKKYVTENFNIKNITTGLEEPIDVAYETYTEWLKTHEDLQLGANLMTNQQLFWIARAVVEYRKLHRDGSYVFKILGERLFKNSFKHDFLLSKNFQSAFNCSEENVEEKDEDFEYLSIFGINSKDLKKVFDIFKFLT